MTTNSEGYYLAFTKDHEMADALKIFIRKFGSQPEEVFIEQRVLWLGPVSREEMSHA